MFTKLGPLLAVYLEDVKIDESKYSLTPKKLLQKVFQLILLGSSVLFNILKVYQNRSSGKGFFKDGVQDGRRNL